MTLAHPSGAPPGIGNLKKDLPILSRFVQDSEQNPEIYFFFLTSISDSFQFWRGGRENVWNFSKTGRQKDWEMEESAQKPQLYFRRKITNIGKGA